MAPALWVRWIVEAAGCIEQGQGLQHRQSAAARRGHCADAVFHLHPAEGSSAHHGIGGKIRGGPAFEAWFLTLQSVDAALDPLCQRALVKGSAPLLGQDLQGAGQGWVAEQTACWQRRSARQVKLLKSMVMAGTEALGQGHGAAQPRAGQEPIAGQTDGRREGAGPWPLPQLLMGLPEQGHGSGHSDRMRMAGGRPVGQRFTGGLKKVVAATARRGRFTAIENLQGLTTGIPVQEEASASESGTLRFHHSQHRLRCYQGIHGVATAGKNTQGCLAGQGVGSDDHRRTGGGGHGLFAGVRLLGILATHRSCAAGGEAEGEQQQQGADHQDGAVIGRADVESGGTGTCTA